MRKSSSRRSRLRSRCGRWTLECRKLGISEQTFYSWKKKYAGMGIVEMRRVKQLEDENRRLKGLVADLTLDKHMLQEVLRKKF
jgi:putative transposase